MGSWLERNNDYAQMRNAVMRNHGRADAGDLPKRDDLASHDAGALADQAVLAEHVRERRLADLLAGDR